jgi:tryptophan 7-halogenase
MRAEQPIETIVIAGGGVAGWLAAAALARRTRCRIRVIEQGGVDDSLGIPFRAEPTLPSAPHFFRQMGFDEDVLLRAGSGSFALGRALVGWRAGGPAFHPYGDTGAPMGPIGFHHLVHRLRAEGESVNLANYALAALCAQAGRFARPAAEDASVLSTLDYGLHLDVAELRETMKADALSRDVSAADGAISGVQLGDAGLIDSLTLQGGELVAGDFFLDCSGPTASLVGHMPGARFEDWSHWLPCDAALISTAPDELAPLPFGSVEAHPAGWRATTALQGRAGEAVLCASAVVSGFEAGSYRFVQGRRATPWQGNCLALGGAAAVIDPVASTQIHLAGNAIARLLSVFPHDRACRTEAAEYNRQTCEELDNARDFAILHYKANRRIGDPFWDDCRLMQVPDRLAHKIALYESTGRIALHDEESFESSDWIALFDAMNVQPRSYDAMADAIDPARIGDHLAQVRAVMLKAVASLPTHGDYLRAHGILREQAFA